MIDRTFSHCYGIIVKNDEYAKILSQITDGEKYDEFIDNLSRPVNSYDDNTDYFIGFQDYICDVEDGCVVDVNTIKFNFSESEKLDLEQQIKNLGIDFKWEPEELFIIFIW
jgi:hypothetical protein